jgi:hypothetical protein
VIHPITLVGLKPKKTISNNNNINIRKDKMDFSNISSSLLYFLALKLFSLFIYFICCLITATNFIDILLISNIDFYLNILILLKTLFLLALLMTPIPLIIVSISKQLDTSKNSLQATT